MGLHAGMEQLSSLAPTQEDLNALISALPEAERYEALSYIAQIQEGKRSSKITDYKPYAWQKRLHDGGEQYIRRMGMAGNRTGKTFSAAAETGMHATGKYATKETHGWDWDGWRCKTSNPLIWTGSMTNETSRDIIQESLLGPEGQHGTGAIPKDDIIDVTYRQAGVKGVVDTIRVKHYDKNGNQDGIGRLTLKTYDQGWKKWQGKPVDFVWLDEEPDHFKIYTEAITRLTDTSGRMLVTFTPLSGMTEIVTSFMDGEDALVVSATWDDAPHLDERMRTALLAAIPEHEREARAKGVPMLGVGRIFSIKEEDILCNPFEIPRHFFQIAGIDFGVDHPFGYARIAIDRDKDIWYLCDAERMEGPNSQPLQHAAMIKSRGDWIPVAWPHDGLQRGKSDGVQLYLHYRKHLSNLMSKHAHYKPKDANKPTMGAQPQEPIIMEFQERMVTGRLKVFRNCQPWLEEFRAYHRDEKTGKPVPKNDDVLKASFYAAMMARYARQPGFRAQRAAYTGSIL